MGLNEEPAPLPRVALVAEETWQEPISEMISAATLAIEPASAESLSAAATGAQTRIEWAPECAFAVEILHLPSSSPNRKHNKDNETNFTDRGRSE